MHEEMIAKLRDAVINYDMENIAELARQMLSKGVPPLLAIEQGLAEGIRIVGEKFGAGEIFLPELVMGAEAMKSAMAVLEPALPVGEARSIVARFVIGTVQDDIHEIGKNLVATMLSSNGFDVHDLGVNCPSEKLIMKAKELKADFIGVSALMTTTMPRMGELIELLKEDGSRAALKVMVGGAPVTDEFARKIGADGYSGDAAEAVHVAKRIVGKA